jgi:hypothetical protein
MESLEDDEQEVSALNTLTGSLDLCGRQIGRVDAIEKKRETSAY